MSADSDEDFTAKVRMTKSEWERFNRATLSVHGKAGRPPRSRVIRDFMRWYMREPGAKQPERPEVGPWSDPSISPLAK